jgi:nucleoside-diphosphate-sugar epimerase
MQTYILILIGILVLLLIGVVYFGWRKIINLEIESNKNKYDIEKRNARVSSRKFREETNWKPQLNLENGLELSLNQYLVEQNYG